MLEKERSKHALGVKNGGCVIRELISLSVTCVCTCTYMYYSCPSPPLEPGAGDSSLKIKLFL